MLWNRYPATKTIGFGIVLLCAVIAVLYNFCVWQDVRIQKILNTPQLARAEITPLEDNTITKDISFTWPQLNPSEDYFVYVDHVKFPDEDTKRAKIFVVYDSKLYHLITIDGAKEGTDEDDGTTSFSWVVFGGLRDLLKDYQGKQITLRIITEGEEPITFDNIVVSTMREEEQ